MFFHYTSCKLNIWASVDIYSRIKSAATRIAPRNKINKHSYGCPRQGLVSFLCSSQINCAEATRGVCRSRIKRKRRCDEGRSFVFARAPYTCRGISHSPALSPGGHLEYCVSQIRKLYSRDDLLCAATSDLYFLLLRDAAAIFSNDRGFKKI